MTTTTARNPRRLPPVHPGEVLNEEFLSPMQITQYRLAKAIGVDARRIHSIVHGQRSITAEKALLLSRFFGNSAAFWMGLQSQYDLETAEDRLAGRLDAVTAHSRGSRRQLLVKLGGRFSMKAATASLWSAVIIDMPSAASE